MSLVENGAKWISTNTGNLLHRNLILHHDIPFLDTKKIWVKIVSAFVILFNIWYALAVFASVSPQSSLERQWSITRAGSPSRSSSLLPTDFLWR